MGDFCFSYFKYNFLIILTYCNLNQVLLVVEYVHRVEFVLLLRQKSVWILPPLLQNLQKSASKAQRPYSTRPEMNHQPRYVWWDTSVYCVWVWGPVVVVVVVSHGRRENHHLKDTSVCVCVRMESGGNNSGCSAVIDFSKFLTSQKTTPPVLIGPRRWEDQVVSALQWLYWSSAGLGPLAAISQVCVCVCVCVCVLVPLLWEAWVSASFGVRKRRVSLSGLVSDMLMDWTCTM